ncbi:MAG TPA: cystathionine gamma-synthase [Brevundimonas sp.]|uniref:cystathionine gamma-synthase n=1 Tax=Brevundimonas sp. TaxID=1871086 RepID=UPI002BE1753D|nr:cystathionine gamma-synthase [Brevundimonas sp.]HRH20444.1 cystathionine gamma-synthase [Brevundimonas sp.]
MTRPLAPSTQICRTGVNADPTHGAVIPPLYLSSNFSFDGLEGKRRYDYTRSGNPTRDLLADAIADLEGGCGAVVTATGMAAVDLALSVLEPGDLLVAPHDCYGGTHRLLTARARRGHFSVTFVDQGDDAAVEAALKLKPRLLLIETPSNPLLRVVDVEALCRRARAVGTLVAVDNTFLSPALQTPIALGADIVIHSTTKYINGHSDVVGGAVVAADPAILEQLAWWANCLGTTGSPFDSWLTLRGVRTLFARIERQQATAGQVAEWLQAQPQIAQVNYPGLKTHPQHDLAVRQQKGFGAMLSVELHGGIDAVRAFAESLSIFTLAESLGGVESLIAHPALMTHAAMAPEARRTAGISDGLVRLSIGLEHESDLIADLTQALAAIPANAKAA